TRVHRTATAHSSQDRRDLTGSPARVIECAEMSDDDPLSDSTANARSLADWNLRSAFFSRQRAKILCSPGGPCHPDSLSSGGSSRRIAVIVSADVLRLKARLPESISYNSAPKAKMADRASVASPRTCSGDI